MLRLFKSTGPGVILLILFTAAVLWVNTFTMHLKPMPPGNYNPGVLFELLNRLIAGLPITGLILAFLLILALVVVMISFNTSSFFLNERTFLPGSVFIILTSLFINLQILHPVIPASLLLLLAIMRVSASYRKNGIAYNYFDAGLMISTGSLFYPSLIWYGLLLIVGILLLRTVNVHEIAVSVLGLLTPYVFLYGIYYVTGNDLNELTGSIGTKLFTGNPEPEWSRMVIVAALYIFISLIIALSYLATEFTKKKVKSRKVFSLLIWVGILTILIYIFSPAASDELIYVLAIPGSYILAHFLIGVRRKKIVPELLFTGILLLVLLVHVLEFFRIAI